MTCLLLQADRGDAGHAGACRHWCCTSIIVAYELSLARAARRDPAQTARTAQGVLHGEWVGALSKQPGSKRLAVQALRNSLMSATITASTAALVLMGSINLLASHQHASYVTNRSLSILVVLEVGLVLAVFAAVVCSAMAMRYYHHVGFAMSLPVGSTERSAPERLAITYAQRGARCLAWPALIPLRRRPSRRAAEPTPHAFSSAGLVWSSPCSTARRAAPHRLLTRR